MDRRNELIVRGDGVAMLALMSRFKRTDLLEDWTRDEAAEERLHLVKTEVQPDAFCFKLRSGPLRPVILVLQPNGFTEMRVSLVSTTDGQPQTDTDYNRVLGDFLANVLIPLGIGLPVKFIMEPPRAELGKFVSPDAMDRLREFRVASTIESQSYAVPDLDRWNRFIIQAHRDESYIGDEELEYWLRLHGFSDEHNKYLLDKYTQTGQVLREYDKERVH